MNTGVMRCGLTTLVMSVAISYELEALNLIVHRISKTTDTALPSQEDSDLIVTSLREEADRLQKKFIHEVFAFHDDRQLERYIQFHQQGLVQLIDHLTIAKNKSNYAEDGQLPAPDHLQEIAIKQIENILEYIEQHFSKYFDQDAKAPQSYIQLATVEAVTIRASLTSKFEAHVERQLIDLALKPIASFIESSSSKHITYRAIMYVRDVQKELNKIIKQDYNPDDLQDQIRTTLIYLNYNTLSYFSYFVSNFTKELNGLASVQLLERLLYLQKSLNQLQTKPGVAYNFRVPSIKDQLVSWITEEIAFAEKAYFLNQKHPTPESISKDNFKLKTDMSVSQLAFLLKLLIEVKVIKNNNTSEVIRFFCKSFQTNRLESISYESFRVRFYNTEESTRRSLRSILLQIVDRLNKE